MHLVNLSDKPQWYISDDKRCIPLCKNVNFEDVFGGDGLFGVFKQMGCCKLVILTVKVIFLGVVCDDGLFGVFKQTACGICDLSLDLILIGSWR